MRIILFWLLSQQKQACEKYVYERRHCTGHEADPCDR